MSRKQVRKVLAEITTETIHRSIVLDAKRFAAESGNTALPELLFQGGSLDIYSKAVAQAIKDALKLVDINIKLTEREFE